MTRRKKQVPAEVCAIPRFARPIDVVNHIMEDIARGGVSGVIAQVVFEDRRLTTVVCGKIESQMLSFAGAKLFRMAIED